MCVNLIGGRAADSLVGNPLANTIDGGPGAGSIRGAEGDDRLRAADGEADTAIDWVLAPTSPTEIWRRWTPIRSPSHARP